KSGSDPDSRKILALTPRLKLFGGTAALDAIQPAARIATRDRRHAGADALKPHPGPRAATAQASRAARRPVTRAPDMLPGCLPRSRRPCWRLSVEAAAGQPATPDSLIERCLSGDQAAWETIVRQNWRKVFNVAYKFVGKHEEAEDLTQDIFLKL